MNFNTQNKFKFEDVRSFYENKYYGTPKLKYNIPLHYRRLAKKIKVNKGQNILDVACGTGEWLSACYEIGAKPFGIDISQKAVSVCKQKMPNGFFLHESAEYLPFKEDSFESRSDKTDFLLESVSRFEIKLFLGLLACCIANRTY